MENMDADVKAERDNSRLNFVLLLVMEWQYFVIFIYFLELL